MKKQWSLKRRKESDCNPHGARATGHGKSSAVPRVSAAVLCVFSPRQTRLSGVALHTHLDWRCPWPTAASSHPCLPSQLWFPALLPKVSNSRGDFSKYLWCVWCRTTFSLFLFAATSLLFSFRQSEISKPPQSDKFLVLLFFSQSHQIPVHSHGRCTLGMLTFTSFPLSHVSPVYFSALF